MRLGMVIDTARCIGCDTCAVACKVENNLPDGVWWNRIETVGGSKKDVPAGRFPDDLSMWFLTIACQQCEDPPCVPVCPTGATYQRDEDGLVVIDYDKCIGCGACVLACPYDGVRTRNVGVPEYSTPFPVGGANIDSKQGGTVSKCTFCTHRIDQGLEPACIVVCPVRARFFGDLDDPESEVSELLKSRETFTLRSEEETKPRVHFLK